MSVKARAGGQGRVRTGRVGVQIGSGSSPGSPTGDGGALSPQTIQFFDRLVILPTATRQTAYATLIDGLVSSGVWAKLDVLYVYAADNQGTALVNLNTSTPVGVIYSAGGGPPTFTIDSGFTNCGAPSLRAPGSGFGISSGGHFALNDAMICAWQIGSTPDDRPLWQEADAQNYDVLITRHSNGTTYWAMNGNNSDYVSSTAPADPSGFWLAQRTGSTACELYHNDTLFQTSAMASVTLPATEVNIDSNLSTGAVIAIGSSMTSGQKTALYSGFSTYLSAVGAI